MTPCTCKTCCEEKRREWIRREQETRERLDRERREAYERKHGRCPTVTEILRRNGIVS